MKLDLFLSLLGRQEVQFGKLVISLSFLRLRSWSVCLKTMYQSPHLFLLETLTYQGGQTIWPWDLTWPLQMCLAACICTCLGIPGCRLGTSSRCFLTRHWTCLCLMSRCELIIGKDNKLWESPSPFVGDSPQPPPPGCLTPMLWAWTSFIFLECPQIVFNWISIGPPAVFMPLTIIFEIQCWNFLLLQFV